VYGLQFVLKLVTSRPKMHHANSKQFLLFVNLIQYIYMDLQEVEGSCGDWMELAQDRDRRRALVNTVRNLRVPKMRKIS
jgi:hypothetical protein